MSFDFIAKKLLAGKAPSTKDVAAKALLGASVGKMVGSKVQNRAAAKAFALEHGVDAKRVKNLRAAMNKRVGDDNPISAAYSSFSGATNPDEAVGAIRQLMEEMTLRELEMDMSSNMQRALHSKRKYVVGGTALGALTGGVAPLIRHNMRVKQLSKRLRSGAAAGTAIAGASGGALALYKKNKEKKASFGGWLSRMGTRLTNLNRLPTSFNAARQAGGTVLAKPIAQVADGAGVYAGSLGEAVGETSGLRGMQNSGLFGQRAPLLGETTRVRVGTTGDFQPLRPNQWLTPNVNGAPMQLQQFNPVTGAYMEPINVARPMKVPGHYTAQEAAQARIPSAQQAAANAAARPAAAAPTPGAATTTGAVAPATAGATTAAQPAAQTASSAVTSAQAPAVPPSPADLAAKAANTAEDSSWVKKITDSLPDGPAKDFAVKHGATIAMIMAPLVAHMGERAAFNVAMKQTMEKAAPWAAGGLAAGAGFGMLSNRRGE